MYGHHSGVSPTWDWSDAWVATALKAATPSTPASLADVVRNADMLNHAILRADDLERAVRRLVGSGLVAHDSDRFVLTDEGQAATALAQGGLFEQVNGVLARLRRIPLVESEWTLDARRFREAVRSHLEGFD